jgi:hypothetical protein
MKLAVSHIKSIGSIEPLEPRIAPAAVVTFTDIDGDLVKITASKGPLDAADLTFLGGGAGGQLSKLNLTDAGFQGADIKIAVTKKPGGDGKVHVGFIDATGRDLRTVVVPGDLALIVAGDADTATTGLASLSVASLGRLGTQTAPTIGALGLQINGLGSVKVKGDIYLARVLVDGGADGRLDSLAVGGSIIGGGIDNSGIVFTEGQIGKIVVKGSLLGSTGASSGRIDSATGIGSVSITGNVIGGSGAQSGMVSSGGVISGSVFVGGNVVGGTGKESGRIAAGAISSVQISGSLVGGAGEASGSVRAGGDLFFFTLGGDLIGSGGDESGTVIVDGRMLNGSIRYDIFGGNISGSQSTTYTGVVIANSIGAFTIGGSIFSGQDSSTGSFLISGGIVSESQIGSLTIKGSVVGANGVSAYILAKGAVAPTATSDIGIGKLTIGGRVERAIIGAGYVLDTGLISNGNAQIGSVTVGGDWITSTMFAGIRDKNGDGFGGADDEVASDPATGPVASIASILIKGDVIGSPFSGATFGFLAQQIGKFKANNAAPVLTAGKDAPVTLNLIGGDVFLREI